jgi:chitodextrinase
MNLLKNFIPVFATLLFSAATAQTYVSRSIDFRDSLNGKYLYGTGLGTVLLHGYLSGELKAYAFDFKEENVKWKPVPPGEIPAEWDPKLDYYAGDRVTYKGKYYECAYDITQMEPTHENHWWNYDLKGEPVSTIYSFPGESDTTTKAQFLKNFILYDEEFLGDPWQPSYAYYSMDVVAFNGLFYECLVDNEGRQPDTETEYWQLRYRQTQLYSPRDLYAAEILYARTGSGGSSLVPQMISAYVLDDMEGLLKSVGLNFKFQETMAYLSRQRELPMVCRSRLGYTGAPQLLIADHNTYDLLQYLQTKLKEGKLKPAKNGILHPEYDTFLATAINDVSVNWVLTQDVNTNDIFVSARHFDVDGATYTRVLKLSWKNLAPLLAADVATPRTWDLMEGIQANMFNSIADTLAIDTLQSLPYNPVTIPPPAAIYFIDQHSASMTTNPESAQAMKSLWSQLLPALSSGRLEAQPWEEKPFLCDQPFPEVVINEDKQRKIEKAFRLERKEEVRLDSMHAQLPAAGIIVEYRRVVTPLPSRVQPFKVQKLGVRLYHSEGGFYADYFFKWDDVKKIVHGEEVQRLMESIEKGKLVFDTQNYLGGLMGVRDSR